MSPPRPAPPPALALVALAALAALFGCAVPHEAEPAPDEPESWARSLAGARAADGDPAAASPAAAPGAREASRAPPTRIGTELLDAAPVLVVGRTIALRPAGAGLALLRVRVLERMRGDGLEPDDEIAVFAEAGQFRFGSEDLLALRPVHASGRYAIVQRVSELESRYETKLSVIRRQVWLMDEPDAERRADTTLVLLLFWARDEDDWLSRYALDELRWIARRRPALFTPARRALLASAARSGPAALAAGVESVARLLAEQDARLRLAAGQEQSRP